MTRRRPRIQGRQAAFAVALGVVALLILESSAYLAIALISPRLDEPILRRSTIYRDQTRRITALLDAGATRREMPDDELGWLYRPGFSSSSDQISIQGLRSSRLYGATHGSGVVRVALFGDSFVYGNEVSNSEAWSAVIERLDPSYQVLNYGVGGYGVDQAYLRFLRDGSQLRPDVVVIGFTTDDLRRLVNRYRRFISTREIPLAKPRFTLSAGRGLELVPNPLQGVAAYRQLAVEPAEVTALGSLDYWYEPLLYECPVREVSAAVRLGIAVWIRARRRYLDSDAIFRRGVFSTRSEAFQLQVALFEQFVSAARARQMKPIIVFLPDQHSVQRARNGRPTIYGPLVDTVKGKNLPFVDLIGAFTQRSPLVPVERLFAAGGHYSREGNRLVAAELLRSGLLASGGRPKP